MNFPHGEPVTRERRPRIQDPYHPSDSSKTVPGEWADAEGIPVPGAFVASSSSIASTSATRSQVLTSKSLYCKPDADIQVGDRIHTASGVWYVNELPTADVNPFTGWRPVREVPLDGTLG